MSSSAERFRSSVRRFVHERVLPELETWEREARFPRALIGEMGAAGFFLPSVPEPAGTGPREDFARGDFAREVALAEELGASLATGLAMSVLAHAGMVIPLLDSLARTDGIRGWLSDAREGRALLGLGVTEASSGGDMNAIETVATFENDGILLRGAKRYVTNGSTADAVVVLARIEEGSAPWSTALVLVPTATPGVTRSRLAMAGLRSGDTGAIELRDCRVPSDHLLGEPRRGFLYVMAALQRERLLGALGVNALARSVLERTVAFCRGRVRMGEPLIAKQAIRHRLAELEAKLEAGRHFAWAVAERFARGEAVDREVWMLKVFCYEAAQELVAACAHLHGAEALLEDHWMSRALHDAEAFTLAAGSAEIMREMLAAGYDSGGPAPATGGRRPE